MPKKENVNPPEEFEPQQVLAALEPDQLAAAKQRFPRRSLKGAEMVLVWSLRLYLLFMIAVVVYQLWSGAQ